MVTLGMDDWFARHFAVEGFWLQGAASCCALLQPIRVAPPATPPPPLGLLSPARSCRSNNSQVISLAVLLFLLQGLLWPTTRSQLLKIVLRMLQAKTGPKAPNQTCEAS